jgi:hypothetical protein
MATAIHNSYSAIVPAVYGTATPVIDVGHGAASINAAVALTDAGSVVVNLGSAPPGAVTYTASGLAHEMSLGSLAPAAAPVMPARVSAGLAERTVNPTPGMPAQELQVAHGAAPPLMARGPALDGVYDGSGIFQSAGAARNDDALPDTGGVAVPGSLISTQA